MTFIENVFKYGVSKHEPSVISINLKVIPTIKYCSPARIPYLITALQAAERYWHCQYAATVTAYLSGQAQETLARKPQCLGLNWK
jgi:hypothetical protein